MSLPGWYPDPAGTPNRFRFWDGQAWSPETTDDPATAIPGGPGGPGGPDGPGQPGNGRRYRPLIVILIAVIAVALMSGLVLRALFVPRLAADPGPLPSSTVTGWDDSSPSPSPSPMPTLSPTPRATPAPTADLPIQPCPQGDPTARQNHPSNGRVHGGGLSFPEVPGWGDSPGTALSWAYDVGEQSRLVEPPDWYATLSVGALFTGDGFDEPRRSAELVMRCVITSGLYRHLVGREDVWSKAVSVDGYHGWSIRARLEVDDPELETAGDTAEVIVIDTGSPEALSMFVGLVDSADPDLLATLDSTVANLRVE